MLNPRDAHKNMRRASVCMRVTSRVNIVEVQAYLVGDVH